VDVVLLYSLLHVGHYVMNGIKFELNDLVLMNTKTMVSADGLLWLQNNLLAS